MNELQTTLQEMSALHTIFVAVVFLLGMTLFTAKLGENQLKWAFLAMAMVAAPIVFVFVMFS